MIVIVTIDLENIPDPNKFADMRRVALKLTNNNKSIKVRKYKHNDDCRLETHFSMKNIAQYKVVDDIFQEFEYVSGDYDDYIDISVSFRK
jgi:hypothetical protein